MPWKMNGENIAMQDGKPVWINAEGKEAPFDAEHALNKIGELNNESAARKRDLRDAQEKLKVLEGVENPAEFMTSAKKALETVANLDAKKLIDAGEAQRVKDEAVKAMQGKIDEANKARETAEQTLQREMIGGRFARSKFIAEKLAIPPDMVEARFGQAFRIEDGKVVAVDQNGNKIFSREKPGDPADFDEALSMLMDAYPYKESILRGSGASGSGAGPQGGSGGAKTMARSAFEKQAPAAQMKFIQDGGTVTD